jgi:hypothetical protein
MIGWSITAAIGSILASAWRASKDVVVDCGAVPASWQPMAIATRAKARERDVRIESVPEGSVIGFCIRDNRLPNAECCRERPRPEHTALEIAKRAIGGRELREGLEFLTLLQ